MNDHTNKTLPLGVVALLSLGMLSPGAQAQVRDLQQQQQQQNTPPTTAAPASGTQLSFGGYVKLDAIWSNPSAGAGVSADQQLEPGAIPVGPGAGADEHGQVKLHARQSRLFAKAITPTELGNLSAYIEGDFFGAAGNETVSNSNGFRIRHAYGTLGGLLAGQTWTNFSDPSVYPETVDFGGPAAQIFSRQAQVRWTHAFDGGQWSVALENPESQVTLKDGTIFRADDDKVPDLTGQLKFQTTLGDFSVAGLLRQIRVASSKNPVSRESAVSGGLGVNGFIRFGQDDLRLYLYGGQGVGRYSNGLITEATLGETGPWHLAPQWLGGIAYRHVWSDTLRSTAAVSALKAHFGEGAFPGATQQVSSAHLNLIWSPVQKTNFGLEYIRGHRQTVDGLEGHLDRVQASAQFLF